MLLALRCAGRALRAPELSRGSLRGAVPAAARIGQRRDLRVAVIGQGAFGASAYREIVARGHEVVGVFTVPDVGAKPDPLALASAADGVATFKMERWMATKKNGGLILPGVLEQFADVEAELNVLAFVTQLIPMEVCEHPKHKSIVYHPSILPRHRGASAINWTLMEGDEKAGLSVFWADDGLDTGPILLQRSTFVDPEDTVSSLYDRFLYPEGVKALGDAVDLIEKGRAPRISQEGMEGATYDPIWKSKAKAKVDFGFGARRLHDFIRGNDRIPGAWVTMGGDEVTLYGSQFLGQVDLAAEVHGGAEVALDGSAHAAVLGYDGLYLRGADGLVLRVTQVARASEGGAVKPAWQLMVPVEKARTFELDELSAEERAAAAAAAAIWRELLGLPAGPADAGDLEEVNFFAAGAGSMDVTALCARLGGEAGVSISPDAVFGHADWPAFVGLMVTTQRGGAGQAASVEVPAGGRLEVTAPNGVKCSVPRLLFVNGKFLETSKTFSTVNPATGQEICQVAEASAADVHAAAVAAHHAFQPDAPWRQMPARERGRLIARLADLMDEHKEELASLEAMDSGAVYTLALKTHVGMSVDVFRYMAGWCDKIHGKVIPISDARPAKNLCLARKEPMGPVALVVPWNYPLMMLAWKMSACLAAGNTCVIKPAKVTSLTSLKFAELSVLAGIPPGVINVLPGSGEVVGEGLTAHPLIKKVGFTGSTGVGKRIMAAASGTVKKVSLELGGKSPLLIFADCDLDKAVRSAVGACTFNKGENCIAAGRIFVQDSVLDAFVEGVSREVGKMRIGDPFDGSTSHGPQNHRAHFEKLIKYVERGVAEGATLVRGGKRYGETGYFLEPAVFRGVEDHMWVAKEESFGPVMLISVFDGDLEKVCRRANATEFGLAAGVFTKDIDMALRAADLLQGGTVFVNVWNKTDVAAPFGGHKQSGFGKDMGEEALNEYLQVKTVTIEY